MTKTSTSNDSFKLDRKTIERNRRIHIKTLFHQLASHIPSNSKSKFLAAQQDQLDLAARYINHMKERIDKLKKQKEQTMRTSIINRKMFNSSNSQLPLLELRDFGSCIEVVLVTGLNNNNNKTFMFYQVISVLEEEGAQVVTATFTTVGDKIFYTLHAQVKISRLGVETTRIYHRLREFIAPLASKLRIIRLNA